MTTPASAWIPFLRALARGFGWLYPPAFRRSHQAAFGDLAEHRFERERGRRRRAWRAAGATTRVLVADVAMTAPAMWLAMVTGERERIDSRGTRMAWLFHGGGDVRHAWRLLWRQPGFSLLVVLTLAAGIGTSAAAFDALDRAVLRPLPFPDADRLAYVIIEHETQDFRGTPPAAAVERWRAAATTVAAIGGYRPTNVTYRAAGSPEQVPAAQMTAGLPALLQVRPVHGRMLGPTDLEPGAAPVVMISDAFWRQRLGGAPDVLEQSIRFGDLVYRIVGVWPARMQADPRQRADVFFIANDDIIRPSTITYVIARLVPGATHAMAEQELRTHSAGIAAIRTGYRASVTSPSVFLSPEYVRGLWLAFAAAILLYVVAVGNTTSLLLSRAAERHREIGLRLALGSSTWRLVRQFFVESAILAAPGAGLAIGVAAGASRLLAAMAEGTIPQGHFSGVGTSTGMVAAGGAFVAILACTLVPVVIARRSNIRNIAGAESGARVVGYGAVVRRGAVVVQSAIGVLLLAGAAIMSRSVSNLTHVDVGFDARQLVTFTLAAPASRYPTPDAQVAFLQTVRDHVASIPGVTGVATSLNPLFRFSTMTAVVYLDGESVPEVMGGEVATAGASPRIFETLGLRLRAGRWIRPDDPLDVVVINESFARARGGQIIGRRLFMASPAMPPESRGRSLEIVGVVADVVSNRPSMARAEDVQMWTRAGEGFNLGFGRFIVRTSADPSATLSEIRRQVAALDSTLPILAASTGVDLLRIDMAEYRLVAVVLASLGVVGLVLAVAGVYGSVALDVRRRTREVGVRVALGATARQVVREVLNRGLRPVALGIGAGALAWFWVSQTLSVLLFRVEARDPISVGAGIAALVVVGAIACLIPARRASRIDPAITLRSE